MMMMMMMMMPYGNFIGNKRPLISSRRPSTSAPPRPRPEPWFIYTMIFSRLDGSNYWIFLVQPFHGWFTISLSGSGSNFPFAWLSPNSKPWGSPSHVWVRGVRVRPQWEQCTFRSAKCRTMGYTKNAISAINAYRFWAAWWLHDEKNRIFFGGAPDFQPWSILPSGTYAIWTGTWTLSVSWSYGDRDMKVNWKRNLEHKIVP